MKNKMKNEMKFLNHLRVLSVIVGLLLVTSCGDDDSTLPEAPSVTLSGDASIVAKPEAAFSVTINLDAPGGNKALLVFANEGLLETIDLDEGATSITYDKQTVPADLAEGETYVYQFALTDLSDQESARVDFTIIVAVYDEIAVGSETLYNVAIPTDGIVESGNTIKLITGRNYFISAPLSFASGSSLAIEEGVTVYMEKPTEAEELSVELILNAGANVSIVGTSASPVVMTPATVLTASGDETPEPGDWNRLFLDATTNATVTYLRTEYASDGLRLRGLDNTNTIQYIQTFKADDEGFYITDGNLGAKYLIDTDSDDEGFRIGDAFAGKLQFGITVSSEAFDDKYQVEIRETAATQLANFTLVGPGKDEGTIYGFRFTGTSDARVYNSIVSSFEKRGVRIAEGVTVGGTLTGPSVFAYGYVFDFNEQYFRDDTGSGNPFQGTMVGDTFTNPFFNNGTGFDENDDLIVEAIAGIGPNDFVPDATVPAKESFDPSSLDTFFSSVTFVGAVENEAGDWTKGWVKNPDGSIR